MYNKKFDTKVFERLRPYFNIPDGLLEPGEKPLGPSGVNNASLLIINQIIQGDYLTDSDYMESFGSQNL